MNRKRRLSLKSAIKYLDLAIDIIGDVCSDEQDSLDNLPENLQNSDRYSAMESAVESLEEAIEKIEEAKDSIDCAAA